MTRKRFDSAPHINVKDEGLLLQQVAGSTANLLEVKSHNGSTLMAVDYSGTMTSGASNSFTYLTATTSASLPANTTIGTVSPTELGYLDGVTSALQTQLDAKSPLASPTFTGTVTLPSTTSIGNVSATELGYLDGVTSALQTQLNTKAPTATPTFTGLVTSGGYYAVGTTTLNRASATAWNAGGNINFQIDGTLYSTIGVNSNSRVQLSGGLDVGGTIKIASTAPVLELRETTATANVDVFLGQNGTDGEGLRIRYESGTGHSLLTNIFNANLYLGTNNTTQLTIGAGSITSSVNINYTSSNLVWMGNGVWDDDSNWSGVGAASGNRILMRHPSSNAFYLISYYSDVYIRAGRYGSDYVFSSTAFTTNGRTVAAGGGAVTGGNFSASGSVTAAGSFTAGGAYNGPHSNGGAIIRLRSSNEGSFTWDGSFGIIVDATRVKNFTIPHPTKPDNYLVHACSEGPTSDVFYRGEGRLNKGIAIVELPDYFEDLTELEGRTVMITPIADEHGVVANLAAYEIQDGQFVVEQIGGYNVPDQRFWWRVDAVRKGTSFPIEPLKSEVRVGGFGPYTFIDKV